MINSSEPTSWKELENAAARILAECGMQAEVGRKIKSARGSVRVDAYALDKEQSPPVTYICECKYWGKNVPQSVVHSFRTVLHDIGANVGLLICRRAFQRGAIEASENSNVRLLRWHEFEAMFERRWIERFFCNAVKERVDPLCSYTEPLCGIPVADEDLPEYRRLYKKHSAFGFLVTRIGLGPTPFPGVIDPTEMKLPLSESMPKMSLPKSVAEARSFRDLLDAISLEGRSAIKKFRKLNLHFNGKSGHPAPNETPKPPRPRRSSNSPRH